MRKKHKTKHNKKRNTAFLYEVLIQDITRSVVGGDTRRKKIALGLCKEFFNKKSVLRTEKDLYDSLMEAKEMEAKLSEKVLAEAKRQYDALDKKEVFNKQTDLISKINKQLSSSVFSGFVSNYKDLATIAQIFNKELPIKHRILLESSFLGSDAEKGTSSGALEPTDNLIYKTFVKNYNKKYEDYLLEEQKEVITRYATSFSDNGVSLKVYLNEEFGRLKSTLKEAISAPIIKEDGDMLAKTEEVLALLESYKKDHAFQEDTILQILEIQNLAKEMDS
tara:strand:- start:3529 stop:4362 length:834 start_codon:yes stop_codon:yes gene_type:complete